MFSQISGHSVTQQVDPQKLIIRLPLLTTGTEIPPNIMPRMQDMRTFIFIEFMVQLQSVFFFLMSSRKWNFIVFLSIWHFDQAIKIYTQTFTLLKNTLHESYTFIIDRFLFCIAVFHCRICLRPNRSEPSLKEDSDCWSLFFLLFLDYLMTSNPLPGIVLANVLAKY